MKYTDGIDRRETAAMLGCHADTISDWLHEGLASAVLNWGGGGKPMVLSRSLVQRWHSARSCRRDGGGPCFRCRQVLEDAGAVGEHLLKERHGYGAKPCCRITWGVCQPCVA
jgi:hypothetical protein